MGAKIFSFLFHNRNVRQSVAKNTFWLAAGQVASRLLRAALVIAAARTLGPSHWGPFAYAMTLVAFLTTFSDAGVSAIITRESVNDEQKGKAYFANGIIVKCLLLGVSALIILAGRNFITNIEEVRRLLPLAVFILIFDSLRNTGFAVFRSRQAMQWEALNEVLTNGIISLLGFYLLSLRPDASSLAIAYIGGTAAGAALLAVMLRRYLASLSFTLDIATAKELLRSSLPFALANFLGAIMINTDLLMVGWLRSPAELGLYSAAQKPVQLLYGFGAIFASSLFPVLSRMARESKAAFTSTLERSVAASLLAALPVAAGGIILGGQLIKLFFGNDYLEATRSFQILMMTVIVVFPSIIVSNAILAHKEEKKFVIFSLLGAAGNILFNFALIPIWGIAGCSLATLLTQLIANGFIWKQAGSITPFSILPRISKSLIGTGIASAVIWTLKVGGLNPIANICTGAAVYGIFLIISKDELVQSLFLRKKA